MTDPECTGDHGIQGWNKVKFAPTAAAESIANMAAQNAANATH